MAPQLTTAEYFENWAHRSWALQLGFVLLWVTEALGGPDLDHRNVLADNPVRTTPAELLADPVAAMTSLPVLTDQLVTPAPPG